MTTTETASPPSTGTTPDQDAIAGLLARVVAAWADHDAAGFASVFTADGTMILPGSYRKGSAAIREYMAEAFAGRYAGTRVTGRPIELRFLGSDVAVLHTLGGVLEHGQAEVTAENAVRATWFVVRGAEGWQLAAYQNCSRD